MTPKTSTQQILLVEDNPADMELIQEWISENKIDVDLKWIEDGATAMNYLIQDKSDSKFPSLILLDINLPRMSGIDVLHEIKTHVTLKKIPVVMLTSSSTRDDVNMSYLTHANAFVQKSLDLESFYHSLKCIHCLFLKTSIPPEF